MSQFTQQHQVCKQVASLQKLMKQFGMAKLPTNFTDQSVSTQRGTLRLTTVLCSPTEKQNCSLDFIQDVKSTQSLKELKGLSKLYLAALSSSRVPYFSFLKSYNLQPVWLQGPSFFNRAVFFSRRFFFLVSNLTNYRKEGVLVICYPIT